MTTAIRAPLGVDLPGPPEDASGLRSKVRSRIPGRLFWILALGGTTMGAFNAYAQSVGSTSQSQGDVTAALQEVVVTAQKRIEKAVDVPISTTAVTSSALQEAGVTSVADLAQVVPGLRIDESGPYILPTIRGVSSVVAGAGLAPNIATYVDGFYRPDPLGNENSFSDVDSVQVLEGPQGTLFGRNTTGGAILVTTMAPSFTPSAQVQASYGNYNEAHLSVFGTASLNDVLAFSISGHADRSDGFVHNIVTGAREGDMYGGGVRAKLLYAPNDDTSITLSLEHSHLNDPNGFTQSAYHGESDGPIFVPGAVTASQRGQAANNDADLYTNSVTGAYLTGKFDFGAVKLASYTGYQYIDVSALQFDLEASSAPFGALSFPETDRILTQEFDLSGSLTRFNWLAGLFYMHQEELQNYYNPNELSGTDAHISDTGETISASAVFADGTYEIMHSLFLTGGVRVGSDRLSGLSAFAPNFIPSTPHHTFNGADGRVVLRYQIDPNSNVYSSVNWGSKSGSFNASTGDPNPLLPERITAYEVGYKIARPTWSFDTAAYDYEYKDMQVTEYVGNFANDVNAGAARIYGLEGQLRYDLRGDLLLNAGVTYSHATYLTFNNAERYLFSPVAGVIPLTGQDAAGNPTERTPKYSGNLGLTYHQTLAGGTLNLTAAASYQSKIDFDPFGDVYQGSYGLLNLRFAWTDPTDSWRVALYGKNVTNTTYLIEAAQETTFTGQIYGRPATYGVEFTYWYKGTPHGRSP